MINLKLDDLYKGKCDKCKGEGKYDEKVEASGLTITTNNKVNCKDCDGRGIKLTETGKVLEEFIKILKEN